MRIWKTVLGFLGVLALIGSTSAAPECNNRITTDITRVVNDLFNSTTYDRRVRPYVTNSSQTNVLSFTGDPITVLVNMHITALTEMNYNDQNYRINSFLRQQWRDERLCYNPIYAGPEGYIKLTIYDTAWLPDNFFVDSMSLDAILSSNYLRIYPDGTCFTSQHISVQLKDVIDVSNYPFSTLKLNIRMESYGYTTKDLVFAPMPGGALTLEEDIKVTSKWKLTTRPDIVTTKEYATGNFTQIHAGLDYTFKPTKTLITILTPNMLVVILSTAALLLKAADSLGVRFGYGLSCLFARIALRFSNDIPIVDYMTILDKFTITDLSFIFLMFALYYIEYTTKRFARKNTIDDIDVYKVYSDGSRELAPKTIKGIEAELMWQLRPDEMAKNFTFSIDYDVFGEKPNITEKTLMMSEIDLRDKRRKRYGGAVASDDATSSYSSGSYGEVNDGGASGSDSVSGSGSSSSGSSTSSTVTRHHVGVSAPARKYLVDVQAKYNPKERPGLAGWINKEAVQNHLGKVLTISFVFAYVFTILMIIVLS
uniref:Neurotransmitter-gated ion-channel ligand-binding domain-containing protein n=1 Tax=viral metagenome TaxID=1070528 RepID=A0A6C0CJP3_9ZZZZ